jgi:hypothetical protein
MSRAMIAACLRETGLNDSRLARLHREESRLLAELAEAADADQKLIEDDLRDCRAKLKAAAAGGSMWFWLDRLRDHPLAAQFFEREQGQFQRAAEWDQVKWEANRDSVRRQLDAVLAREFAVPVPSILSLEATGLGEIVYPGLEEIPIPESVVGRMPSSAAADAIAKAWPQLLASLCDTVRMNRCVSLGNKDMDRSASYFPVGKWMSLNTSGQQLASFLPGRPGPNRRTRFIGSVLGAAGSEPGPAGLLTAFVLEAAFEQLQQGAQIGNLAWLEPGSRQVSGRVVVEAFRIRLFELSLRSAHQVFQCPRTGIVWPRSVLGCAPIRGSDGGLVSVDQAQLDAIPGSRAPAELTKTRRPSASGCGRTSTPPSFRLRRTGGSRTCSAKASETY